MAEPEHPHRTSFRRHRLQRSNHSQGRTSSDNAEAPPSAGAWQDRGVDVRCSPLLPCPVRAAHSLAPTLPDFIREWYVVPDILAGNPGSVAAALIRLNRRRT